MKTTGLTFGEAVRLAKNGTKIRRLNWFDANCYVTFLGDDDNARLTRVKAGTAIILTRADYVADDWMAFAEPPKPMTFMKALEHIEACKCVRRLAWFKDVYVRLYKDANKIEIFGSNVMSTSFTLEDYKATDWIEVEVKEEEE